MTQELALTTTTAAEVFQAPGGLKPYAEHIRASVTGEVPDVTTKKGRDRIASLAAQVSRSKTAVEKPGREYLKQVKELPKKIEAELREFVRECDALRDEVRAPLNEWEHAEKMRQAELLGKVTQIRQAGTMATTTVEAQEALDWLLSLDITEDEYQESAPDAAMALLDSQRRMTARRAELAAMEAQAAENERLRAEAEAKRRADEIAAAERAAEQRAKLAAEQAAAQAAQQAAQELAKAEAARKAAEEQAIRAKLDAERQAQAAVEAEQRRAEQERQARERAALAAAQEAQRKAADREHQASVNREIVAALVGAGLTDEQARAVVVLAASGKAGRLTVSY